MISPKCLQKTDWLEIILECTAHWSALRPVKVVDNVMEEESELAYHIPTLSTNQFYG